MRTKTYSTYDRATDTLRHGVKILIGDIWAKVMSEGEPLLFDNSEDAETARIQWRKFNRPVRHHPGSGGLEP